MKPPVEAPTSRQTRPDDVDREGRERGRELVAAARDVRGPLLDLERGARARSPCPALVTRRPSTRTRPAITSAWARLRVSASPRSQSS